MVGLIMVVGTGAAALGGYFLGQQDEPARLKERVAASPSPSPSPSPLVKTPPGEVRAQFPRHARGEALELAVEPIPAYDDVCTDHHVGRKVLYWSDCANWPGFDIYIYAVGLKNTSQEAGRFRLRNFGLVTRTGLSQYPVNVRAHANLPQVYLQERSVIPPDTWLAGYLVFDARLDFVPRRLSYVDESSDQVLTVTFNGKHSTR